MKTTISALNRVVYLYTVALGVSHYKNYRVLIRLIHLYYQKIQEILVNRWYVECSDLWLCKIINQSHFVTQIPVIYHHGYILIALWRNRNSHEIRFNIEHQFCHKLHTDHQWSLFPGKYYQILLNLLTIRPWRDHGSDRNASGTLVTDFFFFVILYF